MYADASVTAAFTPLPTPTAAPRPPTPTCIRAVYKGAPDDYAQVQDIPDSVLIQPDDRRPLPGRARPAGTQS